MNCERRRVDSVIVDSDTGDSVFVDGAFHRSRCPGAPASGLSSNGCSNGAFHQLVSCAQAD